MTSTLTEPPTDVGGSGGSRRAVGRRQPSIRQAWAAAGVWLLAAVASASLLAWEHRADLEDLRAGLQQQALRAAGRADLDLARVVGGLESAAQAVEPATQPDAEAMLAQWVGRLGGDTLVRSIAVVRTGTWEVLRSSEAGEAGRRLDLSRWGLDEGARGVQLSKALTVRHLVPGEGQAALPASVADVPGVAVVVPVSGSDHDLWAVALVTPSALLVDVEAGPAQRHRVDTGPPAEPGAAVSGPPRSGVLTASATLQRAPWQWVAEVDLQDWRARWWRSHARMLALALVLVLLLAAWPLLLWREIVRVQGRSASAEADRERRRLHARRQLLAEAAPIALFTLDEAGVVQSVNAHWTRLWRPGDGPVVGQPLERFVERGDRAMLRQLLGRRDTRVPARQRLKMRLWSLSGRTLELVLGRLPTGQGWCGAIVDVHDLVAQRDSQGGELLRAQGLLDALPMPWWVTDPQGRLVQAGASWQAWPYRNPEALPGGCALTGQPEHIRRQHRSMDQRALQLGRPVEFECPWAPQGVAQRETLVVKRGLPWGPGGTQHVVTVLVDLTDLRGLRGDALADLSHEFRSPLQTILGYSELGASRALPAERVRHMFADILAASHRLEHRVSEVIDAADADVCIDPLALTQIDFRSAVAVAMHRVDTLARDRGVRMVFARPDLPVRILAEPGALVTALAGVLQQALDATLQNGCVVLDLRQRDGEAAQLAVLDGGGGVGNVVPLRATRPADRPAATTWAVCRALINAQGGRTVRIQLADGARRFEVWMPHAAGGSAAPSGPARRSA